jgi:hypothetical protein
MSCYSGPEITNDGLVLCLDAANPKSYSTNVFTSPTDIYSWNTAGSNCTLSRDTITSPVGLTPLKMVITGNDPYTIGYSGAAWKLAPAVSGQTWTISCWVKASVATTIEGIWVCEQDALGNYLTGGGATSPTIGTSWTRISGTYTLTNASTAFVGLRMDGTQTGGTGITVWWDGIQLERTSAITNFNSKTNTNGMNWFNQSGNINNGTLVNTPTYSSTNSGSLFFNGTSDYISCGSLGTFYPNGTISLWINAAVMANYNNPFSTQAGNIGIRFEENATGTFGVVIGNDAGTYTAHTYFSSGMLINTWYNIVLVWNVSSNNVVGYLNGTQVFNEAQTYWATTMPTVTIGAWASPIRYWNGSISNVQIYNIVLSADQIKQNFNSLRGRYGI